MKTGRHLAALAFALMLAHTACGGTDKPPKGTGNGSRLNNDCTTDADCPSGKCEEVTPGGFRTCLDLQTPVSGCNPPCTQPYECYPPFAVCGGPQPNGPQCIANTCLETADCNGNDQVCLRRGLFSYPVGTCIFAYCLIDDDCTAEEGGRCVPVEDPCCGIVQGLYCSYPSNGCRKHGDCGEAKYCNTDFSTGVASCIAGTPPCPE